MKALLFIVLILGVILALWLGWTYYSSGNLENPPFQVLRNVDRLEFRQYEPYIIAKVTVEGNYSEAINQGFRILAGYIFGKNKGKKSISMTVPVTQKQAPQKIAMTAPVTQRGDSNKHEITFMMPSQYTLETLPVPNDKRISFERVPAKKYAVISFSWYATASRVARKKKEMVQLASAAGLKTLGEPILATYNDPFSFPLLMHHEIWLEVQ